MRVSGDGVDYGGGPHGDGTILVKFGRSPRSRKRSSIRTRCRAVGTEPPALADDNGVVIEFWRRDGETADESYDEIRGWAIGNSLPVRGAIEV